MRYLHIDIAKCWMTDPRECKGKKQKPKAIPPITISPSMCQVYVNGQVKRPLRRHDTNPRALTFFFLSFGFNIFVLSEVGPGWVANVKLSGVYLHLHMDPFTIMEKEFCEGFVGPQIIEKDIRNRFKYDLGHTMCSFYMFGHTDLYITNISCSF